LFYVHYERLNLLLVVDKSNLVIEIAAFAKQTTHFKEVRLFIKIPSDKTRVQTNNTFRIN
jgi:hypothetical protein